MKFKILPPQPTEPEPEVTAELRENEEGDLCLALNGQHACILDEVCHNVRDLLSASVRGIPMRGEAGN